jgi:16S rRNA C967 or C1407 C5-methylase (RsmB/RsmF family)
LNLPEQFKYNMRELLGDEVEAYVASLDEERSYGIRVNTLRSPVEEFSGLVGGIVTLDGNIPWCKEGFYYKDGQPGRHPYYHAGLYYIQEPSAMFPGATIACKPGDYVLDICAAPGGKSTQAACGLGGEG